MIVGIDTGLHGGIVGLVDGNPVHRIVMPVESSGKKDRNEYCLPNLISTIKALSPSHVFVEKLHPLPTALKLGGNAQFWRGASIWTFRTLLCCLSVQHTLVSPQTWQKVMLSDSDKDDTKEASEQICRRLWPATDFRANERCRTFHNGLCDAALIAEFGRRSLAGGKNA